MQRNWPGALLAGLISNQQVINAFLPGASDQFIEKSLLYLPGEVNTKWIRKKYKR
jgi:hypothetical protein